MTTTRRLRVALLSATGALLAPAALAADDAKGGLPKGELLSPLKQGLPAMIAALLVFGIVFFVLARFVWPKISQGLDARAEKIRNEIEAAELAQQQAKSALAQYEKNLADARAEAQKMLDDTKAQQAALAADLKAKADAELSAMREKARHDIDIAKRAAINEIYAEASGLATTMAGKILKRDLSPGDQARLVEESLAEMKSLARTN